MDSDLTPVGMYNFRNQHKTFGIKVDDRRRHIYVVGKTGVGKSTLLENMIIADIRSGKGVGIVDPHGELAEKILDFVPEERLDDVIYFDPSDMEYPIAFNPMEQVGNEFRHLVASGIMGVFKKIWPDAWSARMEYILNNTLLALLELPDATLLGILRMFAEPEYRKKIVENLKDPVIKAFWQNEFARYSQKLETEALAAIQNKVGQFVSNPLIRNILGQPRSALNMRQIMDTGKIFIVNLSKGKIGEDNSALLGAMIITRLNLAAMSRVDIPEHDRRDFFLYVDEFQNFATDSFANILSEARKYHLSLTLAHQYIGQLTTSDSTKVRDAIFGNVGTIITFRVGAEDGEFLEKEFMPEFLQTDLVNLAKANIYIKLMIDGVASRPFSAETIPPQPTPLNSYRDVIIKNSRQKYGTPRAVVESRIAGEWLAKSDDAIGEKIERQGERRLSEVLRPGSYAPYSPGRPPMRSPSGPSSRPSSILPTLRPPRRVEDVQRQESQAPQAPEERPSGRVLPQPEMSSVRPEIRPQGTAAATSPERPMIRPTVEREPLPEARPIPRAAPSREATQAAAPDRSEVVVRPSEASPLARPVSAPISEKKPVIERNVLQKEKDGRPDASVGGEAAAPLRELSLSALRVRSPEMKEEDGRKKFSPREPMGPSLGSEDASGPEASSIKRPTKPNVDIEGLRRAINESLQKQNEAVSSVKPVSSAIKTSARSPLQNESSDPVGAPASVRKTVRLNVPVYEDVDAGRQVDRELSKIQEGRDSGVINGDGHDEAYDTPSVKEVRARINLEPEKSQRPANARNEQNKPQPSSAVRRDSRQSETIAEPRKTSSGMPVVETRQGQVSSVLERVPVAINQRDNHNGRDRANEKTQRSNLVSGPGEGFVGPAARTTFSVPPKKVRKGPDIITSG